MNYLETVYLKGPYFTFRNLWPMKEKCLHNSSIHNKFLVKTLPIEKENWVQLEFELSKY